jgi:hypothetical protein
MNDTTKQEANVTRQEQTKRSCSSVGGRRRGAAVCAFLLGASLQAGTAWADAVIFGDVEGGKFGNRIALTGDYDGDGVPDLGIGVPDQLVAGLPLVGRARVFSTGTRNELRTLAGETQGDRFGNSIAGLPDVDGDGVPDLLVGATRFTVTIPRPDKPTPRILQQLGRFYVVSGASSAFIANLTGIGEFDRLGKDVLALGDVDADGIDDFAVSSQHFSETVADALGGVVVYSGASTAGGILAARYIVGGTDKNAEFGGTLARLDDWDGDGIDDFAVGARLQDVPKNNNVLKDAGAVFVFSGAAGAPLGQVEGTSASANLGAALGTVGDLDGDGHDELLAGAPGTDLPNHGNIGRVVVFSSRDLSVLRAIDLPVARRGFRFGTCLAGLPDVDGDGVPDFAAGAPGAFSEDGAVLVLSGATGEQIRRVLGHRGSRLGQTCLALPPNAPGSMALGAPGEKSGGIGDAGAVFLCGQDSDGDGAYDCLDNCPGFANPGQLDADHDAVGDDCDTCVDPDGDGFAEIASVGQTCQVDRCPGLYNLDHTDSDGDGFADACDNCIPIYNPAQTPKEVCRAMQGELRLGRKPTPRNTFSVTLTGGVFETSMLDQAAASAWSFSILDEGGAVLFYRDLPAGSVRRAGPYQVILRLPAGRANGIDKLTLVLKSRGVAKLTVRGRGALPATGIPRARIDFGDHHLAVTGKARAKAKR